MIKFFTNSKDLHQFTLSLDFHQNTIHCDKCSRHNQFVAHGFDYKKQRQGHKKITGKQGFCSNQYRRVGCGSIHRLYLAGPIPKLQHNTDHLFCFLLELIACVCVQAAYRKAIDTDNPRHAYPWINKLGGKHIDYSSLIKQWQDQSLLLPTCQLLFVTLGQQACSQYQLFKQTSFVYNNSHHHPPLYATA